MSAKTEATTVESSNSTADTVKLVIAVAVLLAAIVGYYEFDQYPVWARVLGMLAAIGISSAIASQTPSGAALFGFLVAARAETRRVVWPTRKEVGQTTLVIAIVVLIVSICLFLIDSAFAALVSWLMRG